MTVTRLLQAFVMACLLAGVWPKAWAGSFEAVSALDPQTGPADGPDCCVQGGDCACCKPPAETIAKRGAGFNLVETVDYDRPIGPSDTGKSFKAISEAHEIKAVHFFMVERRCEDSVAAVGPRIRGRVWKHRGLVFKIYTKTRGTFWITTFGAGMDSDVKAIKSLGEEFHNGSGIGNEGDENAKPILLLKGEIRRPGETGPWIEYWKRAIKILVDQHDLVAERFRSGGASNDWDYRFPKEMTPPWGTNAERYHPMRFREYNCHTLAGMALRALLMGDPANKDWTWNLPVEGLKVNIHFLLQKWDGKID